MHALGLQSKTSRMNRANQIIKAQSCPPSSRRIISWSVPSAAPGSISRSAF